jgi:hypothetical protein
MTPQMLFLAGALAMGAAGPQQPSSAPPKPSSNTPGSRQAAPALPAKVTVEGCVATGAEIPNHKADFGEKTGLDQHFVLVNGRVVKGKPPVAAPAASSGVVSAALSPMYHLHGLTDEQLKLHVGHRVRIDGRFTSLDASTASASPDTALVQLDVATIRQVPGDCSVPRS